MDATAHHTNLKSRAYTRGQVRGRVYISDGYIVRLQRSYDHRHGTRRDHNGEFDCF